MRETSLPIMRRTRDSSTNDHINRTLTFLLRGRSPSKLCGGKLNLLLGVEAKFICPTLALLHQPKYLGRTGKLSPGLGISNHKPWGSLHF